MRDCKGVRQLRARGAVIPSCLFGSRIPSGGSDDANFGDDPDAHAPIVASDAEHHAQLTCRALAYAALRDGDLYDEAVEGLRRMAQL